MKDESTLREDNLNYLILSTIDDAIMENISAEQARKEIMQLITQHDQAIRQELLGWIELKIIGEDEENDYELDEPGYERVRLQNKLRASQRLILGEPRNVK